MRIERARLYALRMPLVRFFETSFGRVHHRDTLIVRLEAQGLRGYGECPADRDPLYAGEVVETCAVILEKHLLPRVLGRDVPGEEALVSALAPVRGNRFARTALEAAYLDLLARSRGLSLRALLGGTRRTIESGVSLGVQDRVPDLLEQIEEFVGKGYRRIKLKIKPGWDVEVLARVRERFPDVPLSVDANAAYSLADLDRLRELDAFDLMMVEQPFHPSDLVDHAVLQRALRTPVCLDESVIDLQHARAATALGSMRVLNVKAPRVGGFLQSRAIHDHCRSHEIPVWCGGLLETGVGRAHNIALASLPGFTLPGDVSGSARYWQEDVIDPPVVVSPEGTIDVPQQPGLGFDVVEERLERHAFAVRTLSPGA